MRTYQYAVELQDRRQIYQKVTAKNTSEAKVLLRDIVEEVHGARIKRIGGYRLVTEAAA